MAFAARPTACNPAKADARERIIEDLDALYSPEMVTRSNAAAYLQPNSHGRAAYGILNHYVWSSISGRSLIGGETRRTVAGIRAESQSILTV